MERRSFLISLLALFIPCKRQETTVWYNHERREYLLVGTKTGRSRVGFYGNYPTPRAVEQG